MQAICYDECVLSPLFVPFTGKKKLAVLLLTTFGNILIIYLIENSAQESESYDLFRSPDNFFSPLDDVNDTFAVSAFMEPDRSRVRIFLFKRTSANPQVYCSYGLNVSHTPFIPLVQFSPTFTPPHRNFKFHPLIEYKGEYRGYVIFCDIPHQIQSLTVRNSLYLILRIDNPIKATRSGVLIVQQPLPELQSGHKFPHRVAMCITPWFNTEKYTSEFLVEYIEVHRVIGISLFVFYMTEPPSAAVKSFLNSYLTNPNLSNQSSVSIQIIPWTLPIENASQKTWYKDQVLSYNDCIYRFAQQAEYIFYADFDEVFVPNQELQTNDNDSPPTWFDVIERIQSNPISTKTTYCFPGRFFPPNSSKEDHRAPENLLFDRHLATVEVYPERKKCLVRSGQVKEVYVHWPISPRHTTVAEELGVILHYRDCLRKGYTPCDLQTKYALNHDIDPYRQIAGPYVRRRLAQLR